MAFTPWTRRPGLDVLDAGLRQEQAQSSADASYDHMAAPPCVACGQPVSDREFRQHLYEQHGKNEVVQPWGTPDAREALFLGKGRDDLERKIALWRGRHPGVRLQPSAEGTRYRGLMAWARFRVFDRKGRLAR